MKIVLNPKSFLLSDYIFQDMPVLQVSSFRLLSSSAHIADSVPLMAALLAVKIVGIMCGFRSSSRELFLLHIFEGIQNEVQGMLFDIGSHVVSFVELYFHVIFCLISLFGKSFGMYCLFIF